MRTGAIFLPLVLAVTVAAQSVLAGTVTPVRAIRSQTVIAAEDVEIVEEEVTGGLAELADVIGKEARVTLYPGRPILVGQVGAPAVVERNALVRMIFRDGPLSITAEGRVLDRGGAGERVRVMNLASRQIVTGSVQDNGDIEVVK